MATEALEQETHMTPSPPLLNQASISDLLEIRDTLLAQGRAQASQNSAYAQDPALSCVIPSDQQALHLMPAGIGYGASPPEPGLLARLMTASLSNGGGDGGDGAAGLRRQQSTTQDASFSESQLAIISSSPCVSGTMSGRATADPEVQQSLMEMVMGRRQLGAQVRGGPEARCWSCRCEAGGRWAARRSAS